MGTVIEVVVIAAVAALTLRRAVLLVAALVPHCPLAGTPMTPSVTVLVAARNEGAVAERLLASLSKLDYPADRLSFVLVCDGCTDGTASAFHLRRELPRVLLAAVLLFAADLMASLAAVAVHAARRPYRWQSPRPRPAGAEPNR